MTVLVESGMVTGLWVATLESWDSMGVVSSSFTEGGCGDKVGIAGSVDWEFKPSVNGVPGCGDPKEDGWTTDVCNCGRPLGVEDRNDWFKFLNWKFVLPLVGIWVPGPLAITKEEDAEKQSISEVLSENALRLWKGIILRYRPGGFVLSILSTLRTGPVVPLAVVQLGLPTGAEGLAVVTTVFTLEGTVLMLDFSWFRALHLINIKEKNKQQYNKIN